MATNACTQSVTSHPSPLIARPQDQWYWQCKPGGGRRAAGSGSDADVIYVEKSASSRAMGGGVGCQPLQLWERCGGKNMGPSDAPHPGYCCPSGSSCSRDNEWHWQCKPGNTGNSNSGGGQQSTVQIELYHQCGGQKGWVCEKGTQCSDAPWPGHSCPAEGVCRRQTSDYWQCRPFISTDSNPNNNNNNNQNNNNNNQNGNSNNNGSVGPVRRSGRRVPAHGWADAPMHLSLVPPAPVASCARSRWVGRLGHTVMLGTVCCHAM